jgi:hypothetical protein
MGLEMESRISVGWLRYLRRLSNENDRIETVRTSAHSRVSRIDEDVVLLWSSAFIETRKRLQTPYFCKHPTGITQSAGGDIAFVQIQPNESHRSFRGIIR